jgi:hypothetical protein
MMRMLDKPDVSVRLTAVTITPSYNKLIYHNMFKAQGTKNGRWYFLSKDLFPDYGFQFFFIESHEMKVLSLPLVINELVNFVPALVALPAKPAPWHSVERHLS